MHTSAEMFRNMIQGKYDNISGNLFKEKTWKELWDEYLKDSRFWNKEKKNNVFGNDDHIIKEPNLDDLESLDGHDQKFIGEFIRIHHARLAYEIALKGYQGHNASIVFNFENNQQLQNKKFLQVSGLIARSHGMNVRDTFTYLRQYGKALWRKPLDIKVVFLMTLIRLADYIQIDSSRTHELMLKLREFSSQFSLKEHETHLAIDHIHLDNDDKELICVEASPEDAIMYVKIDNLIQDIQKEFDLSWAILGEVYGDQYKLRYRRIESNLTDENVKNDYTFVPKQFGFKFNNELPKLLIAPLYGNDPSYGVRELVQNAVDACRTRMAIDKEYEKQDITHVSVSFDSKSKLFTIVDSGVGMTIEEIENYFLTIGSSYNSSAEWQKTREEKNEDRDINKIYRTGRFGIGILAAFLLGTELTVLTRSIRGTQQGYQFTMSLDKSFLQIEKKTIQGFGTKIVINSDDTVFENINNGYRKWYNWYIDSKPVVKYYYNSYRFFPDYDYIKSVYKKLEYLSNDYGDIYWKPYSFFHGGSVNNLWSIGPGLVCNGFVITNFPSKWQFDENLGVEKYLSFSQIPNLIISDIFNLLPLNLKRDNIDVDTIYPFEKELAIDLCKDCLCQLLAIKLENFRYTHHFFFNHIGYTINNGNFFKTIENRAGNFFTNTQEKCLLDKTLVHIISDNDMSYWTYDSLMKILNRFPDTFITLYETLQTRTFYSTILRNLLDTVTRTHKDPNYESCVLAVNKDRVMHIKNGSIVERFIEKAKTKEFIHYEDYRGYVILIRVPNNDNTTIAKSIINQFHDGPLSFVVYKNSGSDAKSALDDFINEYAGGDMMIPYDEKERHKKFAILYEECADDIEKYRRLYQQEEYIIHR